MARTVSLVAMCCIAMCGLASMLALASDATDVGVIVDYSPPGALLYLEHTGAKQPVRIASVVQAGDKIELPANSSVAVELSDGRRMSSSGPGTWEVPAAPSLGSIATYFHRIALIMDPDYRQTGSAITREVTFCQRQPIVVPALPEGALAKAGRRGLEVNWAGGCPPYRLELKSDHGTVGVESGLVSREFRFEQVSLAPGSYSVSITDKSGANVDIPFTARAKGPVWPAELASNASHLGTVARALWLADIDHGVWRIDSVELLMPLRRERDPLAEAVAEEILMRASGSTPAR